VAVCDARTVATTDLVPIELKFKDGRGENLSVTFNDAHRWFYFPFMTPDEVLLIKGFDSLADGRARFTPHSAFDDPSSAGAAAPRESIEVHTLVLFDRPLDADGEHQAHHA